MRVMILAAGRGERLRPLTDAIPKAMVRAGGKPLLAWHLERLAACGYSEAVINVAPLCRAHRRSHRRRFALRLRLPTRASLSARDAGGIAQARALLGEADFLLVNATSTAKSFLPVARTCARRAARASHTGAKPQHRSSGDFSLDEGMVGNGGAPRYTYAGIAVMSPHSSLACSRTRKHRWRRCCAPPRTGG